MHVHQSLFDLDGNNAFFDPNDPLGYNLSDLAKHYIAGLLKYAPEFCCITNQYVNSYKRLVSGGEAPTYISWGPQPLDARAHPRISSESRSRVPRGAAQSRPGGEPVFGIRLHACRRPCRH